MTPSVEHKLAAILSADVVGYSRLMAEDEDETVRRIRAYRNEIGLLVEEHRGRVVDFTGDNFLAEFPTATDAVEAAAEIQRVIQARNAGVPAGRAMEFRMGIHLGEVRVEGERLYGDGVNIAARLEGLAEPGGICVSDDVLHQVQRKLELDFDDLGEQTVKNIPDPVHAYRVRERVAEAPPQAPRRPLSRWAVAAGIIIVAGVLALVAQRIWPPPPPEPEVIAEEMPEAPPLTSIAVLPFEDMSPGGDQKWLGDGMAEELIEALSRIEALRVIARTSAFTQRGADIATVGELLDVGAVVEGSVRRSGDQLRLTAQLIRVADGTHLWSGRYDKETDEVFAVQEEIAREIAEAIRLELGVQDTWSFLRRSRYATRDVRAYELVKRAVDSKNTWTEEGIRKNNNLCLQALEIDPNYAQAHAELAFGYAFLWLFGFDPREENLAKARAAAQRALELEPTNGSAHNLLAHTSIDEGDWQAAEDRFVSALEATPGHGPLHEGYGTLLMSTGRFEEARIHLQRALDLDPLAGNSIMALGNLHLFRGEYQEAIEQYERAVEFGWPRATPALSYAYHLNGMDDEALGAFVRGAPSPGAEAAWRQGYDRAGYMGLARAALAQLISQGGEPCPNDPAYAAQLLAIVGETDRMFECLNESVERHRPERGLKVHPLYAPYRDDPRFTALLRRMNLAD
jgi:adenylate cyclase